MKISPLRGWALTAMVFATSVLAATVYKVTLPSDFMVGDIKLKKGEYSVSLEGKLAIFKREKTSVEIPVIVDKNPKKSPLTTFETADGKLAAIDLGGSEIKLVFRTAP